MAKPFKWTYQGKAETVKKCANSRPTLLVLAVYHAVVQMWGV